MIVVWDIAPCGLEETNGLFKASCCLHHQGDYHGVSFYQTTRRNISEDSE
jgi:hypothetical protein